MKNILKLAKELAIEEDKIIPYGWDKAKIDLTQEFGYSYIYKRLYELEDKIEAGILVELSTTEKGQEGSLRNKNN